MEKIIKIGNQEAKLSNNVAWLMEYKDQFGKDATQELIPLVATMVETLGSSLTAYQNGKIDLESLSESIEGKAFEMLLPLYQAELSTTLINITWAMAKAADETIDPPKKWVKQFDSFPFDIVAPEVWDLAVKGFVSSKNLKRLRILIGNAKEAVQNLKKENQPLHLMTSPSQDSNED
jgi:hypothetical protein